jgi:porin
MAKRVTVVTGLSLSLLLYGARVAVAQNAAPTTAPAAASQPAAPEPESKPPGMLSLIQPLPDYTGDWTTRKYLTGDWGGARTQLAEKGILFDMDLTQWLQGNAYGGKDTNNAFRYSGSADYYLKFDTARMGLWSGGLITLHGETQIGDNINPKVGSLMRPNYQGLFPVPGEPGITTLSEFYLTQALSEQFIILAGKIDATSLADQNAFASNQRTQFSNVGLRINPVLFNAAPYTCMAAGAIWKPTKWLQIMTAVADNDPDGGATMTGFNTAFHGRDWQTVLQEYDITLKPFGQTGHQRFGLFYTTRDFRELAGDPRIQLPVQSSQEAAFRRLRSAPLWLKGLRAIDTIDAIRNPAERPDNWGLYYNFDQYLFTEAEDPEQGWGVFGRFGFAPNGGNVFEEFYSLGLGGKGAIPHRDRDSWGLGYYLANITDNVSNLLDVYAEQGVELYYNIEVRPWLHITPDLQVIVDPGAGFDNRAPAVVYGLRMQMSF